MAVAVTAASADDGAAAPRVLGQLDRPRFPRLETVWGDAKYRNHALEAWLEREKKPFRGQGGGAAQRVGRVREAAEALGGGAELRLAGAVTVVTARTTSGSPSRARRGSRVSAIGEMLRRLAPDESRGRAPFKYPKKKAA